MITTKTGKPAKSAARPAENLYQLYELQAIVAVDASNGFTELATRQTTLAPLGRERYDLRPPWARVTTRGASVADRGEGMLSSIVNRSPFLGLRHDGSHRRAAQYALFNWSSSRIGGCPLG